MFSKFSEDAQKVLLASKNEMVLLKHPYVGTEHLILAILFNKNLALTKKLNKLNITYDKFRNKLIEVVGMGKSANNWFLYTPLLKRVIENAVFDSRDKGDNYVSVEQLFISILEEGDGVGIRIFTLLDVDIDKVYSIINTKYSVKKSKKDKKLFVSEYSVNFNKRVMDGEVDPVVERDEEVARLIEILSRRCKNNPLLIGEAGVGKTAIVEELARRIVTGDVPKFLQNKTILSVSVSSMVSGTKYRGEFEERVNKILKEVEANNNIILFIDEIHTIVGAGGAEGAIDASNILKPALARGKIRIIGATTISEYHASIEKDKALDRRFQKITVLEPNNSSTIDILKSLKPIYEKYHNVNLSDEILNYIVMLTDSYITNLQNPDKSIDVMDEVCAKASLMIGSSEKKYKELSRKLKSVKYLKNRAVIDGDFKSASNYKIEQYKLEDAINRKSIRGKNKNRVDITKDMVKKVVESKTKIPIYELVDLNLEFTKKNEKQLLKKIVGQDEIVKELCRYTKIIRSGISKSRPYSFLLVGPTGVGKTMLVKEYSKILFGKHNFFRVDMSEYKEAHSISKIIGSPPGYVGYQDDNYVLEYIRNNPHSVLLLDEVEKASQDVLKLFLQAMDEGIMHDASGREVNFKHVVIFMTSNIASNKNNLGFTLDNKTSELKDFFSVEFLNRVDKIFNFKKLTFDDVSKIVKDKLNVIKKKYKEMNINIKFNKKIIEKIVNDSEYLEYGARKIDKIIDIFINNYILDMIMDGADEINLNKLEV